MPDRGGALLWGLAKPEVLKRFRIWCALIPEKRMTRLLWGGVLVDAPHAFAVNVHCEQSGSSDSKPRQGRSAVRGLHNVEDPSSDEVRRVEPECSVAGR